MPQLQSGQIEPGQAGAPKLYGVGKTENSIPFHERLMRLFKPHEFVTIRNITDKPCYWQYMPIENEHESFSEDGMQKIVHREDPEMWVIMPNETEVIVGASAYMALDVMYKNHSAETTLKKFKDPSSPLYDESGKHLPKNFNFSDGGAQDDFISKAYLGKATPTFQATEQPVMPAVMSPQAVIEQPSKPVVNDEVPQYAEPDVVAKPIKSMKELQNVGASKK